MEPLECRSNSGIRFFGEPDMQQAVASLIKGAS
jgi:hypothetical protein